MSLSGLLQELRVEYLETFPSKISLIEALWDKGDLASIETEFHKMKGTGRTYGVPEATVIGEAVESICQRSKSECEPVIRDALRILRQVHDAHATGQVFELSDNQDFKNMVRRIQHLLHGTG